MIRMFHDVEVEGRRTDVLVRGQHIAALAADLDSTSVDDVVDGRGGALLPGLHDHHVHLFAMAAALTSVQCGPPAVGDLDALAHALRTAPLDHDWIRGVGYHESVAGPLDRHLLDRLVPHRPVRVQHRGGALWMLNSRALAAVTDALDFSEDVERDEHGEPTGRLWRYDTKLRPALPEHRPDLARVGHALASYGITGVTEATPDLDDEAVDVLARAVTSGDLPVRLMSLGAATSRPLPTGIEAGPRKLLLRDHDLPSFDGLRDAIEAEHAAGRPVAVHCVTREALLLTLAVLDEVGPLPGDRLEHASVVPVGTAGRIARMNLYVVTQPGLLRTRGDTYLREVHPDDVDSLYPYASLVAAGVPVTASSDAPFGPLDPWAAIGSAVDRTTAGGSIIGADEQVDARSALSGYLSDPWTPGGPPRRVAVGAPADLCLLHGGLDDVLRDPHGAQVRTTVSGGRVTSIQ